MTIKSTLLIPKWLIKLTSFKIRKLTFWLKKNIISSIWRRIKNELNQLRIQELRNNPSKNLKVNSFMDYVNKFKINKVNNKSENQNFPYLILRNKSSWKVKKKHNTKNLKELSVSFPIARKNSQLSPPKSSRNPKSRNIWNIMRKRLLFESELRIDKAKLPWNNKLPSPLTRCQLCKEHNIKHIRISLIDNCQ